MKSEIIGITVVKQPLQYTRNKGKLNILLLLAFTVTKKVNE